MKSLKTRSEINVTPPVYSVEQISYVEKNTVFSECEEKISLVIQISKSSSGR